jgi:hypothetical protein
VEAGGSSLVMATTSSSPKATIVGPSKAHGISKSMKQVAMVVEVEEAVNPCMWCRNCRLLGHGKRNCPSNKSFDGKNGSQSSSSGSKENVTNKGQQIKAQGGRTNVKYTSKVHYAPCGWVGHTKA